jgi:phosphoribosylanthranilate isomerase
MRSVVKVKICGITSLKDAQLVAEAGADLLGFNFYKKSPRYITPRAAASICDNLKSQMGAACPVLVGVFVNEQVESISLIKQQVGLHCAQLHGDEPGAVLKELRGVGFKAIRPVSLTKALEDVRYFKSQFPAEERWPSLLLDAYHPQLYGGTGEQTSDEIAAAVNAQTPRLLLAGGLTPENISSRVQAIQPWGVDTASGVEVKEQPGVKDASKVRAFILAVRQL